MPGGAEIRPATREHLGDIPGIEHAGAAMFSEDLDQARRNGMHVLAVGPPVDQLEQTHVDRGRDEAKGKLFVVPWWRTSPAWQSAADPQEALGEIWAIEAMSLCPPSHGSLYGRLYDCLDMVVNLMGLPDMIDAALSGPLSEPPQHLRHLTGALTAHLRFGEKASAQVFVSDRSSIWSRRMEAIGSEGQLRLCDGTYSLYAKDQPLDALEGGDGQMDAGQLIASQWQRLAQHGMSPTPIDTKAVVACAATILLSCRTGQGESPTTMLRMHGAD